MEPISVPTVKPVEEDDDSHDPQASSSNDPSIVNSCSIYKPQRNLSVSADEKNAEFSSHQGAGVAS